MYLNLNHQNLPVYTSAKQLAKECYFITRSFPDTEKFGLTSQLKRAALSVALNIAEGSSRKSVKERTRFYEIARGSLIEVDAALEISLELNYFDNTKHQKLELLMVTCFKLLTGLIQSSK